MVGNFVIALIVGGGVGFWIYYKFQKSSGGNTRNSAIASVIIAILIAIFGTFVLDMIIKKK